MLRSFKKTLLSTWGFVQAPADEQIRAFYQVQLSAEPGDRMGLHKALYVRMTFNI